MAPCSAVGLVGAAAAVLAGGRASSRCGRLEVVLRESEASCAAPLRRLPFRAITLGHVIIAVTREDLERSLAHELVHVAQYERWGPMFFIAYGASSAWQLLSGRKAYWDNWFEVQARERSAAVAQRITHINRDPPAGMGD